MNNNNKLIHYLNSELQTDKGKLIGIKRWYSIIEDSKFLNGIMYSDIDLKYYMYPLSCLTETIIHEGVEEIPLVELAKIEGTYKGDKYEIKDGVFIWNSKNDTNHCFAYSFNYKCFIVRFENNNEHCYNQLLLFEYCFERRINLFNIKSIDPRELGDNNPYLK